MVFLEFSLNFLIFFPAWKFFDDEMKAEKNNAVFLKNDDQISEQTQKKVNFKDLFWDVFHKLSIKFSKNFFDLFLDYQLSKEDTGHIYLFELSSERQQLIIARGKKLSCPNR